MFADETCHGICNMAAAKREMDVLRLIDLTETEVQQLIVGFQGRARHRH